MPPRAPRAAVSQDIGLTRVSVEYRSPAVRGRQIWGERVAFGEPWRNGDAPQATIGFSRDVTLGGAPIPAGTYTLVATPSPGKWVFALQPADAPSPTNPARAPIRVEVPVETTEPRERLRFAFSSFTASSARLDLEWERVRVSLPIDVDTNGQILSAIAELDRHDAELGRDYAQAAKFLLSKKAGESEREKGLAYLERAAALNGEALTPPAPPPPPPNPTAAPKGAGPAAGPSLVSAAAIAPAPRSSPTERERGAPAALRATHAPGADQIGPVISKGRPAIQTCYQRALRKDPSLAHGKIAVSIAIGTSGMVKSVVVEAPEGLRPVEACVKAAIARWAFPPSPEAYATELPFVFDGRD